MNNIQDPINNLIIEITNNGWLQRNCRLFCKDVDICNDFQQQIVLKLLEKQNPKLIELYLNGDNYLSYLYVIIKNEYLDTSSQTYKLLRSTEQHVRLDNYESYNLVELPTNNYKLTHSTNEY